MHAISYTTAELSLLCKEYKDALEAGKIIKAEKTADRIQKTIEILTLWCPDFRMDSLFFAGELDHHGKEYETEYPESVKAWRERRELRKKQRHTDDEDSEGESDKGHGNTKLPFGLCQRYGIEVKNGWTPREAWEALEGKGVSPKEEYRKLKEKQKAESERAAKSVNRHESAKKDYLSREADVKEKRKELWKKEIEARNRELDIEYGALRESKSLFMKAEQERVKAKELRDLIDGRSKEEVQKEYEELGKRVKELEEMNHKVYDRPRRGTPEREEWNKWAESLGGREAILDTLNKEFYFPGGTSDRYNKMQRALRAYDTSGPDAGYAEAVKRSKEIKKTMREQEAELEKAGAELKEYQKQDDELSESLKQSRKEYFDAVKERFPTFNDCKTVSDIAERLTAEDIFGGDIASCDFGESISVETARTTAESLIGFMDKVPFLKGNCGRLTFRDMSGEEHDGHSYDNVYGYSDRDGVALNSKWYGDKEKLEKAYQDDLDAGFHPEGTTLYSIVQHEYSHQLDHFMTGKIDLSGTAFSTVIMRRVCEELEISENECKNRVSGYSVRNWSGGDVEWFAEAFSEYTSSPNPRPVALAVGKYVNEYAKRYGLIRSDAVDAYRARRQKRLDDKEEGRWVTTENDNRVHINEQGVPDKGNPYVLAAMRGEGGNPRTPEELARHRLQRQARQHKAVYSALSDAKKELKRAQEEATGAKQDLHKAQMHKKMADRGREQLRELGYGEGDREQLQRDYDEVSNEMAGVLQGRDKWSLKGEEDERYRQLEGRANQLKWHLGSYDEYFGPEAVTDRTVKDAEKRLSDAESREKKAQVAADRAQEDAMRLGGSPDQERFLTAQERAEAIEKITGSDMWHEISESGKAKALESLQNVSDAHLLLLQKTAGNVKIHDSHGYSSPSGSDSWYMPGTGAITLSPEDMEKPRVLWHEYGHYLDDPKQSGCDTDSKEALGYTMQVSLSGALEHADALHNDRAAGDLQKLFDEAVPGELEIGSWGNGVLKIIDKKTGGLVESPYDPAYHTICNEFSNRFHNYIFDDAEFNAYCKDIGYPQESEGPKWDDYFEMYNTPKRKLQRVRQRFKGAEEEYHTKLREFNDRREKVLEEHPEFYDRQRERDRRCEERESRIGPISDILCAMFRGNGPWIYGSHSANYYSRGNTPYSETVANYHQMRMMGWTSELNFLKSLVPSVHDELERAYNEWLWRNVDL